MFEGVLGTPGFSSHANGIVARELARLASAMIKSSSNPRYKSVSRVGLEGVLV
ncbi:hypothetical protein Hanom_Chr02g00117141 [Helianthus anomalus]